MNFEKEKPQKVKFSLEALIIKIKSLQMIKTSKSIVNYGQAGQINKKT
jgi:hypothetical protein